MRHSPIRVALTCAIVLPLLSSCAVPVAGGAAPRTDATFARVTSGMPEGEVQQLLGRPDETMRFPASRTEAWDYRYYDTWGYLTIFSVTFGPDGRVASTLSNRINSGGDHGGI